MRDEDAVEGSGAERRGPPPIRRKTPFHHVELAPPFNAYMRPLPPEVAAVPSMMSMAEREFLFNIAQRYYAGLGIIVDGGVFLGASTRCFGEGVRGNPRNAGIVRRRPKPVVTFEMAVTNPTMLPFLRRHGVGLDLQAGDSFEPLLAENIRPVADLVDLRIGDVTQTGGVDEPIAIAFLDVLKGLEIGEYAVRRYFPLLIPGRSLVIQQDYFIEELPFIKAHQEAFADKFEFIGEISSMAVYRCTTAITAAEIETRLEAARDPARQLALISIAMNRSTDPMRRLMVALAKVRVLVLSEGREAGRRYLDFVEGEFPAEVALTRFKRVQNALRGARYLCERGGDAEHLREAQLISAGHRPEQPAG